MEMAVKASRGVLFRVGIGVIFVPEGVVKAGFEEVENPMMRSRMTTFWMRRNPFSP